MLEGESEQSINQQLKMFHERALPDLGDNIKCGNSLIAPDFFERLLPSSESEHRQINPFDWSMEFKEIMAAGGFDVVIGNPPYVRQESLSNLKNYFEMHYQAFNAVADLYVFFIEKGIRLLKNGGLFSIIVSSSFLRATYAQKLRQMIKKLTSIDRIVDFGGLPVFSSAKDTYVCIPLLAKGENRDSVQICKIESLGEKGLVRLVEDHSYRMSSERLTDEAWVLESSQQSALMDKLRAAGVPLKDFVGGQIFYGIKTGLNDAFVVDSDVRNHLIAEDNNSREILKPLLGGEDIRRYHYREKDQWIIFTRRGIEINRYPAVLRYLQRWQEDLTPKKNKATKKGRKPGIYKWYEIQDDVAYYEAFEKPKIIYPDIAKGPRFSLDTGGHYLANTAYCLGTGDLFLLGILNSRLFWFAIAHISIPFGTRAGQYRYRLIYQYMEKVPIRCLNLANHEDGQRREQMIILVQGMLKFQKDLSIAATSHEQTLVQRQIDATDKQIDQLVYELYGLTEEEIKIVESSTPR